VFFHNYVHDNNNPNVPGAGIAAAGPVGTGLSISGGRNDTVMGNRFEHNDAWGVIFVPFPVPLYDEFGNALIDNKFGHNGSWKNSTNGDFAATNVEPGPTDCFSGNTEEGGGSVTSSPSNAEQMYPVCNGKTVPPDANTQFGQEVICDSQIVPVPCLPTDHYPRRTMVLMHPLPSDLQTMPDPCAEVPANPWCPASKHQRHHHTRPHGSPQHHAEHPRLRVAESARAMGTHERQVREHVSSATPSPSSVRLSGTSAAAAGPSGGTT